MLGKLANLGVGSSPEAFDAEVESFQNAYGELYPSLSSEGYWFCVEFVFRPAWHAKTPEKKESISADITRLLERQGEDDPDIPSWTTNDPRFRPGVGADFATGKVEIRPRTLLDWLVKSLLECRDKLAICEREGCSHPYFVKTHARQRFCSPDCANSVRQKKKQQWWAGNRKRFILKWRRQRRAKAQQRKRRAKP